MTPETNWLIIRVMAVSSYVRCKSLPIDKQLQSLSRIRQHLYCGLRKDVYLVVYRLTANKFERSTNMKRIQIDEKYVKLIADEGKVLVDTKHNLKSKEAVCLIEHEDVFVEEDE